MCNRLCCCIAKDVDCPDDELTTILVFGVTGMTGGAVMEAVISCAWFNCKGVSRATEGDYINMLMGKGVKLQYGDLSEYPSLVSAMRDTDVVFLCTPYWEYQSIDLEVQMGINAINACMETGIRHLVYVGTDYTPLTCHETCDYLEGRARVEEAVVNSGIPYTIVHAGFFYENLLGLFKPHKVDRGLFAVAYPMHNNPLNMISVLDFGQCIANIALRPRKYLYSTIKLSAESLTVDQLVTKLNESLGDAEEMLFVNPQITLEEYSSLKFHESRDLTTMWAWYNRSAAWSTATLRELFPKAFLLDDFLESRKKTMLGILNAPPETEYLNLEFPYTDTVKGMIPNTTNSIFSFQQNNSNGHGKRPPQTLFSFLDESVLLSPSSAIKEHAPSEASSIKSMSSVGTINSNLTYAADNKDSDVDNLGKGNVNNSAHRPAAVVASARQMRKARGRGRGAATPTTPRPHVHATPTSPQPYVPATPTSPRPPR